MTTTRMSSRPSSSSSEPLAPARHARIERPDVDLDSELVEDGHCIHDAVVEHALEHGQAKVRLTRARDEPHDAAETIAQVLGSRRKASAREWMGVAVAIGAHRQADARVVLGVDVAVRIK